MREEEREIRKDQGERRKELRRLTVRFFVAVAFYRFTGAGFDGSDQNSGTEFYWASTFNKMAHFSFLWVTSQIALSTVVLARFLWMRSLREVCDKELVLGFIFLMISFSFMVYLR